MVSERGIVIDLDVLSELDRCFESLVLALKSADCFVFTSSTSLGDKRFETMQKPLFVIIFLISSV